MIGVINLDTIAGPGRPRLELAGDTPRSPAPGLVETVRARLAAETGARADAGRARSGSSIDLGFPFSLYEQAPFVARGDPGRDDHDGRRPAARSALGDTPDG